jgi:hypothetical protein
MKTNLTGQLLSSLLLNKKQLPVYASQVHLLVYCSIFDQSKLHDITTLSGEILEEYGAALDFFFSLSLSVLTVNECVTFIATLESCDVYNGVVLSFISLVRIRAICQGGSSQHFNIPFITHWANPDV